MPALSHCHMLTLCTVEAAFGSVSDMLRANDSVKGFVSSSRVSPTLSQQPLFFFKDLFIFIRFFSFHREFCCCTACLRSTRATWKVWTCLHVMLNHQINKATPPSLWYFSFFFSPLVTGTVSCVSQQMRLFRQVSLSASSRLDRI